MSMLEKLAYRPAEAAELCSISRPALYRKLKDGSIKSIKDGGVRLILRSDLLAYLERRRAEQVEDEEATTELRTPTRKRGRRR